MKRLVITITITVGLLALGVVGCAEKEPAVAPEEDGEIVSSCVSCHTDKDLLKEVATPEKEEVSEATSGEG